MTLAQLKKESGVFSWGFWMSKREKVFEFVFSCYNNFVSIFSETLSRNSVHWIGASFVQGVDILHRKSQR